MQTIKGIRIAHIKAAAAGQVTDPGGLLAAWEWLQTERAEGWALLNAEQAIERKSEAVDVLAVRCWVLDDWQQSIKRQILTLQPALAAELVAAHV